MREIKFRGKAINRNIGYHRSNYKNGDWVYGLISKMYDEEYKFPAEMTDEHGISGIDVDYKTIEQYTGLKDNNGKDIYEGDIVKIITDDNNIAVIEYDSEDAAFIVKYRDIDYIITFSEIYGKEVEVIGNIHDNPKMLSGDDE